MFFGGRLAVSWKRLITYLKPLYNHATSTCDRDVSHHKRRHYFVYLCIYMVLVANTAHYKLPCTILHTGTLTTRGRHIYYCLQHSCSGAFFQITIPCNKDVTKVINFIFVAFSFVYTFDDPMSCDWLIKVVISPTAGPRSHFSGFFFFSNTPSNQSFHINLHDEIRI